MTKKERSDKWNEIQIEHTYMLMMLAQIKEILDEEQYKKIRNNIEEEFLKKRAIYAPLNYEEIISQNNLVRV